jgi:hypothetical protein
MLKPNSPFTQSHCPGGPGPALARSVALLATLVGGLAHAAPIGHGLISYAQPT